MAVLNSAGVSLRGECGGRLAVLLLARGVSAAEETDVAVGRKRPEPRSPLATVPAAFERISLLIERDLILSLWENALAACASARA